MRFRIYAAIAFACAIALIVCAIAGFPTAWLLGLGIAMSLFMLLAYRSVAMPLDAVKNGIYLIKAQDFSSSLRPTGQHDADRVISLFNGMMEAMKAERLKNEERNRFLAKLLEVSPMGVAICDFDGNIIDTNPAFRTIATPELRQALATLEMGHSGTFRIGTAQIYRCSRLWFMDSGFRRPFLIVERLTEEIAKAERDMFKKIVRTIGHEVNNTMGSVSSVLETMEDIHSGEPAVSMAVRSSRSSCMDLVAFVKGYSDIVKLPEPIFAPTNLTEEVNQLMPTLRAMTPDNISIVLESEATDPEMLDMMLISRVITNVVKNAAESIGNKTDGLIMIKITSGNLTITDNGDGITEEKAARLFTPFYSTKHPDRGLGLMLVADILRAHNAEFSLTSDQASGLTSFMVSFKDPSINP